MQWVEIRLVACRAVTIERTLGGTSVHSHANSTAVAPNQADCL